MHFPINTTQLRGRIQSILILGSALGVTHPSMSMMAPHSSAPVSRGSRGIDSDRCCLPLESHMDVHLGRPFFLGHQPSAGSSTPVSLRSRPGASPLGGVRGGVSTFQPFQDGAFCLRVFSEKKARALACPFPPRCVGVRGPEVGNGCGPVPVCDPSSAPSRCFPEERCKTPQVPRVLCWVPLLPFYFGL